MRIEQDDDELMIGQEDVWNSKFAATPKTSVFEEFEDDTVGFEDNTIGPKVDETWDEL